MKLGSSKSFPSDKTALPIFITSDLQLFLSGFRCIMRGPSTIVGGNPIARHHPRLSCVFLFARYTTNRNRPSHWEKRSFMNPQEVITIGIFAVVATGLVWLSIRLLRLTREGRLSLAIAKRARERSLRGHQAEEEARIVLEKLGFTVIDRHIETTIGWWIDDAWHEP